MVGDLVALLKGPGHGVLAEAGTVPQDEEGGFGPPGLEAVQELIGVAAGAVVVGDGDEFVPGGLGWDTEQAQQQQEGEKEGQEAFHGEGLLSISDSVFS